MSKKMNGDSGSCQHNEFPVGKTEQRVHGKKRQFVLYFFGNGFINSSDASVGADGSAAWN
jgi:hypothetical protein